jgi:aminoglycoside phosphotransferase family enzyme
LSDSLPKPVKRIDTHAAIVLLSGERAIKIKRNVRYSYLDYSTLERRKEACEREFEVNRRFAPQLYLRVVPIRVGADENVTVDTSEGTIVEWALEMRRFDENELLENRCKRGPIGEELARKVARSIHSDLQSCLTVRSFSPSSSFLHATGFKLSQVPRLHALSGFTLYLSVELNAALSVSATEICISATLF